MNLHAHSTLTPFAARIYGAAAIAAPLLLLASTIAFITEGSAILEGVLGGTIYVWAAFAMIIALVGIFRLIEPAKPRAAAILTVFAVFGWAAGVAFSIEAIYVGLQPEMTLTTNWPDDSLLEGGDAIGLFAFVPWGWFAPLTYVLAGIMLWRTRIVPPWIAALLVVGGVLFIAGYPERIDLLVVVANVSLILAMTPIGWAMLTDRRAVGPATTTATTAPEPLR